MALGKLCVDPYSASSLSSRSLWSSSSLCQPDPLWTSVRTTSPEPIVGIGPSLARTSSATRKAFWVSRLNIVILQVRDILQRYKSCKNGQIKKVVTLDFKRTDPNDLWQPYCILLLGKLPVDLGLPLLSGNSIFPHSFCKW